MVWASWNMAGAYRAMAATASHTHPDKAQSHVDHEQEHAAAAVSLKRMQAAIERATRPDTRVEVLRAATTRLSGRMQALEVSWAEHEREVTAALQELRSELRAGLDAHESKHARNESAARAVNPLIEKEGARKSGVNLGDPRAPKRSAGHFEAPYVTPERFVSFVRAKFPQGDICVTVQGHRRYTAMLATKAGHWDAQIQVFGDTRRWRFL